MVQGNTEVLVNLSAFCCIYLESECIANSIDNEEDNGEDKIWQRDDGDERRAFYIFKTLWMTSTANM